MTFGLMPATHERCLKILSVLVLIILATGCANSTRLVIRVDGEKVKLTKFSFVDRGLFWDSHPKTFQLKIDRGTIEIPANLKGISQLELLEQKPPPKPKTSEEIALGDYGDKVREKCWREDEGVRVRITYESGRTVEGMCRMSADAVSGKSDLGDMTIPLSDVRKVVNGNE